MALVYWVLYSMVAPHRFLQQAREIARATRLLRSYILRSWSVAQPSWNSIYNVESRVYFVQLVNQYWSQKSSIIGVIRAQPFEAHTLSHLGAVIRSFWRASVVAPRYMYTAMRVLLTKYILMHEVAQDMMCTCSLWGLFWWAQKWWLLEPWSVIRLDFWMVL